jgi:hypothetical protein
MAAIDLSGQLYVFIICIYYMYYLLYVFIICIYYICIYYMYLII